MARYRSGFRRRKRTLYVLLAYAVVFVVGLWTQGGFVTFKDLFEDIAVLLVLIGMATVPLGLIWILWRRKKNKYLATLTDFKNAPWRYEKSIITVTGRVEYVFTQSVSRQMKLFFTDLYRTLTASEDHSRRHPHERFLISSPSLKKGENILVVHNTRFGSHALKSGMWATVTGEYLHRRSPRRNSRNLTFYGLLHYTHTPKGEIIVLDRAPSIFDEISPKPFLDKHSAKNLEDIHE